MLAPASQTDPKIRIGFAASENGSAPEGWQPWAIGQEGLDTEYRLDSENNEMFLEARSQSAASALIRRVNIDSERYPVLEWQWKSTGPLVGANWRERHLDDFPVRLFVLFEKRGVFSKLGGFAKKLTGGFTGQSLNYVWAVDELRGESGPSPVSDRVQMVAVEVGSTHFGVWRRYQRNVREDFITFFGETPGRIVGVAIMTDTDDTGAKVTSYYRDIAFLPQEQQSPGNVSRSGSQPDD